MLQGEHSAILSTVIKLPFVIKIFVFSIFCVAVLHRFYCILSSLQVGKAAGPDVINNIILKELKDVLSSPLCDLFNAFTLPR